MFSILRDVGDGSGPYEVRTMDRLSKVLGSISDYSYGYDCCNVMLLVRVSPTQNHNPKPEQRPTCLIDGNRHKQNVSGNCN